jgi:hypothetical protein
MGRWRKAVRSVSGVLVGSVIVLGMWVGPAAAQCQGVWTDWQQMEGANEGREWRWRNEGYTARIQLQGFTDADEVLEIVTHDSSCSKNGMGGKPRTTRETVRIRNGVAEVVTWDNWIDDVFLVPEKKR